MPRRIESIMIGGPAGRLEALLEEPDSSAPRWAALCCHPHPQHGGTMHNKVVYRLARGLRAAGAAVLRFNYRGVNLSEGSYAGGEGELDDARAALSFLRGRYPELDYALAGFSFGARIVHRMGCEQPGPRFVLCAGFPTRWLSSAEFQRSAARRVFLQSTQDEFAPREEFERLYAALGPSKELHWIDAADHFFAGALDELEATVRRIPE
jgi:alpha/beta superfamily hydrolase